MNIGLLSSHPVINIIPEPKHMNRSALRFDIPKKCNVIRNSGDGNSYANAFGALEREFLQFGSVISTAKISDSGEMSDRLYFVITESDVSPALKKLLDEMLQKSKPEDEGYLLEVSDGGAIVVASDSHGLFYAVQTLLQLMQKDDDGFYLPGVSIDDCPDMAVRGINVPLRRIYKTEHTADIFKEISRYKVNTIVLEYDDCFTFESHPLIASPEAWTKQEVKDLIKLAEENCITIVPHFQCLGHAEYILKHDEYKHLREGENIWSQYCPSNPKTLEFCMELCDEILELHPGAGYFHIGGDETYYLGKCEKCKEVADKIGRSGLFVEYINKICNYLIEKGKTPMLWDDMIAEYPDKIDSLVKGVAMVYWDYTPSDPDAPYLLLRNQGYYCDKEYWGGRKWNGETIPKARLKDVSDMSEVLTETYQEYFNTDWYPRYLRHYPFLKFFKDKGLEILGAPAIAGGEFNYFCTNLRKRMDNVVGMIGAVHKAQGKGAIVTFWVDGGLCKHIEWYSMLAGAENMWFFKGVSEKEYSRKFTNSFFGTNSVDIVWAMYQLGETLPLCYTFDDNEVEDTEAYGAYAKSYSYKKALDRGIEKLENNPDLIGILAKCKDIFEHAQHASAVLEKHKNEIRMHENDYARIVLAARLTQHKSKQVLLFHSVEEILSNIPEFQDKQIQDMAQTLKDFKTEMLSLREETIAANSDILRLSALESHAAMIFEGEIQKVDEYIQQMSVMQRQAG